jgi:hypothetical protein
MEVLTFWWRVVLSSLAGSADLIGQTLGIFLYGGLVVVLGALWSKRVAGRAQMKAHIARNILEWIVIAIVAWVPFFVFHLFTTPHAMWKEEHTKYDQQKALVDSEHSKLLACQDNNKPDFYPILQYSPAIGRPLQYPNSTSITVLLRLVNRGAPSVTQGWKLQVQLADGSIHEGLKVIPSFDDLSAATGTSFKHPQFVLRGKDDIEEKTAEIAIERGGSRSGFITFLLKDVNYLVPRQKGTKIVLSFRDIYEKEYGIPYTENGGPVIKGPVFVPGLTGRR